MQQFHAMNIACITPVVLYPGKERPALSQVILRRNAVLKENVERRLSDTEIFHPSLIKPRMYATVFLVPADPLGICPKEIFELLRCEQRYMAS